MTIPFHQIDAITGCSWGSRGELRCKTPEALEAAHKALLAIGYEIQDLRNPGEGVAPYAPSNRWSERAGLCGSQHST